MKQLDPTEVDALHAEVERDMRNGNGAKHFEDVLDELHSKQGNSRVAETPSVHEQLRRFCNDLRAGLDEQVRGQGFRCKFVIPDGKGEGFHVQFFDTYRRPFDVSYSFEEGMQAATKSGAAFMGREIMSEIIDKLLAARARYFARMQ